MKVSKPLFILLSIVAVALQTLALYKLTANTILTCEDHTTKASESLPCDIINGLNGSDESETATDPSTEATAQDDTGQEDTTQNGEASQDDQENGDSSSDTSDNGDTADQDGNGTANGDGQDNGTVDPDPEPEPEPEPEPDPEIILCLGDSVTYGAPYGGSSSTYPAKLQVKINAAYGSGKYTVVNKGQGGWTADQVLGSTTGWLNIYDPKIVLLMVGGNDIAAATEETYLTIVPQTVNEVQAIVNKVKAHTNPDGSHPKLILSAFIPNRRETPWGSLAIYYYNNGIPGFTGGLKGISGDDKYFTTNWSDLYDSGAGEAKASLMADEVHPNSTGYSTIATNWYGVITSYLSD